MPTIVKNLFSIRPIWLSAVYLLVAFSWGYLKNIDVFYGEIFVFITGFIYLLIICIWPIVALVAMNSPTWKIKFTSVPVALIFVFLLCLFSMFIKILFAIDMTFFQENIWGRISVVILVVILFSCYASLYPLYLYNKNKWYHKFFAGYFSILLFVFFPFTIFYIKRKIDIFRTQQLCETSA